MRIFLTLFILDMALSCYNIFTNFNLCKQLQVYTGPMIMFFLVLILPIFLFILSLMEDNDINQNKLNRKL